MLKEYKVKIEFEVSTYGSAIDSSDIATIINKKIYDVLQQWRKDAPYPVMPSFTNTEVGLKDARETN